MNNYYEVIGISSWSEELEKVHITEGVKVIPIEMTRSITPIKDLRAVIALFRVFKKERPFIVHSHTPKAGTVAMLAAKLAGVEHRLHTIAGLPLIEAKGLKRLLLNIVEKATYACATKIYPNSLGLKDIILQHKFTSEKKMKIIGQGSSNGIDTSHFNPALYSETSKKQLKNILGIKEVDMVYIFVGRLVKDKGINELIKAYEKISARFKNTKLILVGTYEKLLDPVLPETENAINTNSNIISVGWQTDVRPYFSISDVLVFPSYREGFPNVVMQAGAMGLFSIVTDINGCNEIIKTGENGVIISPKDPSALYAEMVKYYQDKPTISSNMYREMIASRYERTYVWGEILKEYKSIASDNH